MWVKGTPGNSNGRQLQEAQNQNVFISVGEHRALFTRLQCWISVCTVFVTTFSFEIFFLKCHSDL